MSHEMSKKHQEQVAEKTAILVNHAFRMGIQAERNRIIELITERSNATGREELIELIKREEKND
jgi:parvulin-like peptidyl-prolyl isomerase